VCTARAASILSGRRRVGQVAFQQEHGTFSVPTTYAGGRRLSKFASGLRAARARGDLTEACVRKLVEVGFFAQGEQPPVPPLASPPAVAGVPRPATAAPG
jgi:hypothetical protein